MKDLYACVLAVFALALAPILHGSEAPTVNKAAEGETQLPSADAEKALGDLAKRFKDNPLIKAHLITESEDLMLGTRKDEGELLLDRSGRVLQKFSKPKVKMRLLNGSQLHEYAASRKLDMVKDFSKAPSALKLLQAAVTVDVKGLAELFDISVFSKGTDLRLVFLPKAGGKNPLAYQYIQSRIGAKDLFFNEIEYRPDSGKIVERYSDIKAVDKFKDDDFAMPTGVQQQVDFVTEDAK